MNTQAHYRTAFVVEPGFDFQPLYEIADSIMYLTSGFEQNLGQMRTSIRGMLTSFDPELDVIVPVGKVLAVMLTADLVAHHKRLYVAIYNDRHYQVVNLHGDVVGDVKVVSGQKEPETP